MKRSYKAEMLMTVVHSDLVSLYTEAESTHQSLFAEQRSNLLLVAGSHWNKKDSRFWRRLRQVENLSRTQKLRLTKNHVQKITKTYVNNILAFAPGVTIGPKNESELSDQKAAEIHNSVWKDLKQRHKFKKKRRQWAQDFIEIGECIAKVFYDPNLGALLGYEPVVDEAGLPVIRAEDGEPEYSVIFSGDLVYERIHGFNLLTDPEARSWEEARWTCYRKMVPVKDLEAQYEDDEEKLAIVTAGSEETYKIFDSGTGGYGHSKDLVMVMEFYFRPCAEYPEGHYYVCTKGGILEEGDLPLGIFPIIYAGFDEASTSARSYSIIKQLRPYQGEINRAASKIAEHQITLGDDKVLLMNGSTMAPGGTAHGVKAIAVTGSEPKIFGGRTGEHMAGYMQQQISEMYMISNVQEDSEEKESANLQPYTMLFRTAAQKKRFVLYTEKFQEFEEELCDISLRYAKAFYPDEMLVPIVGKKEFVNIAEFRDTDDLSYQITIEPQSDDLESRMGKQLGLNHLIQYAGQNMATKDLGRVIRSMEYLNKEQLFDDETIDYDNASSDILRLDRGMWVPPGPEENHPYVIRRLTHRTKQKDFDTLPEQTRAMYQQKLEMHRQIQAKMVAEAQAVKDGFIPTGGFLVNCDFYVADPKDPTKQKHLRLPAEAVAWLVEKLQTQGTTQEMLDEMDLRTQARVAQMVNGQRQQLPAPGPVTQAAGFR